MPQISRSKTIFEFLTERNPDIEYESPKSKTLTSSKKYRIPQALKPWDDEFSLATLNNIYGKSLCHESHRADHPIPEHPRLSQDDFVVCREGSTCSVFTSWNRSIVNSALDIIRESFHPARWSSGKAIAHDWDARIAGEKKLRMQPLRDCTAQQPKLKPRKSKSSFYPDDGAIPTSSKYENSTELVPKDYKVALKWHSSSLKGLLNADGEWKPGAQRNPLVNPIRQIYSYCVAAGCRYGCILTTKEAFICRIKPRRSPEDELTCQKSLRQSLYDDGLMEFISVPWTNHRNGKPPEDYRDWTINLALWFLHVIAGNDYQVEWTYNRLLDQELKERTPEPRSTSKLDELENSRMASESQVAALPGPTPRQRKRTRETPRDDIHYSFTESHPLSQQSFASVSSQSFDSSLERDFCQGPESVRSSQCGKETYSRPITRSAKRQRQS